MKNNPIFLLLIFVFIIFILIFVATLPALLDRFNFTETGQIGDTIGGISAPVIGIIGIYYVYKTYTQQINERWYQINIKKLTDIDSSLQNSILVLPTGKETEYFNYDSNITFSGLSAFSLVVEKLKIYENLNMYQRLAIDQFVFDYGRKVKYLEVFMMDLRIKQDQHKKDSVQLNELANHVYYGSIKLNFETIINALRDPHITPTNDPKEIKKQLINMNKNLEKLIIPNPLYTSKARVK